jgi:hypothetical protein
MPNLLTPINVLLNPPSLLKGFPGETTTLQVSLMNQGERGAVIDVFIEPIAPTPAQWCLSARQRVALNPQQGCEVTLPFDLPPDALPGTYPYSVVVDAPDHYPEETPIQQSSQLEILVKEQSVARLEEAAFSLSPATSPARPLQIEPGQTQKLEVQVINRSRRVDRFRLNCPDLDEGWFAIQYPCTDLRELGLLSGADGLELNPGTQGEILVEFHYPTDMPAGIYSPTLQLLSDNAPDRVLLDLVYVEVKPNFRLEVELETLLGKVSQSPGQYRLKLRNHGNLMRELVVGARSRNETEWCDYVYDPTSLRLLIDETAEVSLKVYPCRKWWRRPLFGYGLENPFQVDLQDLQKHPLPEKLPMGLLVWKARPWWQFLLLLLAGVGALAGLGFLIWVVFFKPSPPPILTDLKPDSNRYTAGDSVRLNWTIENADQLEQITLTSLKDQSASKPLVYGFRYGFPTELSRLCQMRDRRLTCANIDTGARQAGKYTFQLQIKSKSSRQKIERQLNVEVQPLPQPRVTRLLASQSQLEKGKPLTLSWSLNNLSQLTQLQITGQRRGEIPILLKTYDFRQFIPLELAQYCQSPISETLTCNNISLGLPTKPGNYAINLQTTSRHQSLPNSANPPLQVQVKPSVPTILAFTLNGLSSQTNPSIFLKSGQVMRLDWAVQGDDVKVRLEPLGDVPSHASKTLKATQHLSQITLTAANERQSVQRAFLIQVDTPRPAQQLGGQSGIGEFKGEPPGSLIQ